MKINGNNVNGINNNIKLIQGINPIGSKLTASNELEVGTMAAITNTFKKVLKTSETKTEDAITDKAALYDVVTTISKAEAELKLLLTLRDVAVNAWNELIKMNI